MPVKPMNRAAMHKMDSTSPKKRVLVVYAQPEPTSLTRTLVEVTAETLESQGHEVMRSDLYGMRWKAVFDEDDFLSRSNPERLSFVAESGNAYATGTQTEDVVNEQEKLLRADAVVFQFPLWWFGPPAILKGWFDRVYAYGLAYGFRDGTNRYRYGEGAFQGKRALLSVVMGGPEIDYSPRGINGPIDQLLFPITHGCLFFPGMNVLPTHTVYSAGHLNPDDVATAKSDWRKRVQALFQDQPIPFRPQDGGDYPDRHTLRADLHPERSGLTAHVAD